MDFWTDIAFAIILRILKSKKEADKVKDALFKVHGKIETMYPELQCGSSETK